MAEGTSDRFEMRVPPDFKERVRRAADARGLSITRFALDALSRAASEVLDAQNHGARRQLGWAEGTARETGDLVAPAAELDEWDSLRE
jgi:hypothetical protein